MSKERKEFYAELFAGLSTDVNVTVHLTETRTQYGKFMNMLVADSGEIWVRISVAGKGANKNSSMVFLLSGVQSMEW